MSRARSSSENNSTANLGFEARLWLAAEHFDFRLSHFIPPSAFLLRTFLSALPGQLFYSTQIPVCLWFLAKGKSGSARASRAVSGASPGTLRNRKGETLFIDARKMGTLIDRVHRELTDDDLAKIVSTYHAWRSAPSLNSQPPTLNPYKDLPGFCKSATAAEIASHGYVLTPGRYVGAEEVEDDGDPFDQKRPRLFAELKAQFAESTRLENAIRQNLKAFTVAGEQP